MWFLYNKTRHGKYMYAIGGNENAAQVAGVNVTATKIRIYLLAAVPLRPGRLPDGRQGRRRFRSDRYRL